MTGPVAAAQVLGLDPETWLTVGRALAALVLVASVVVAGLALYGARRNGSRSMLFLAGGIATFTLGGTLVSVLTARVFSVVHVTLAVRSATELAGLLLILYAIVLARRE